MKLPFITRSHHEEVVAGKDRTIATLETRLFRIEDLIFKNTFGVQLHDTLPVDEVSTGSEDPELTADEQAEAEFAARGESERNRLISLRRTRPTQVGRALEAMMERQRSTAEVDALHPAQQLFAAAKKEAETN